MHPHVTDVLARLDQSRESLRSALASMADADRRRRPSPERWSGVEIVEHVGLVDRRFTAMLAEELTAARAAGLGPETQARLPLPEPVARALGDRTAPRTAPDPARPSGALDEAAAWVAATSARDAFRLLIAGCEGLALSRVVHAHAFFGTLDIYQWVELIAAHEERHARQVREVAAQLGTAR